MPAVVNDGLTDCDTLCDPNNGYPFSCSEKCPGYEMPPSPENVDLEPPSSKSHINEAIIPSVGLVCLFVLVVVCYVYRDKLLNVLNILSYNDSIREDFNTSDNILNVDEDVGRPLLVTREDSTELNYPVQETSRSEVEIGENSETMDSSSPLREYNDGGDGAAVAADDDGHADDNGDGNDGGNDGGADEDDDDDNGDGGGDGGSSDDDDGGGGDDDDGGGGDDDGGDNDDENRNGSFECERKILLRIVMDIFQ